MKKITLLFLLLTSSVFAQLPDVKNFKISNQSLNQSYNPSVHSKVYFDFDIKGDYGSNEIKLTLYYNSVSTSNLINIIRWNREGDYYQNWTTYYKKNTWLYNNFSTTAGKKFILVVEYGGNQKILNYTVPSGDSDGDGFNDDVDNCPNTAGTNNGCPPGQPDLKFDYNGSVVNSDASGSRLSDTHTLNYYTSILSLNLILNNIGAATSNPTQIEFYLSSDSQFSSSSDANLNKTISIPAIGANSTDGFFNQTFYTNTDFTSGLQGYWYIIARIKASDSDDSNNTAAIKVYFNPNRSQLPLKPKTLKSILTSSENYPTYNMEVYDFSGNKIINDQNLTDDEKNRIISELPKGFYIIKTQGEKTVKIYNQS